MFRTRTRRLALTRRGAALVTVIALLTLFAIAGLSFALYAGSAATGSRIGREAEDKKAVDMPDSASAANAAIRHVIFPVNDSDVTSLMSAFRGHSLAETMYGYNRTGGNDLAYNGIGPFQQSLVIPGIALPIPRSQVINFSLWQGPAGNVIVDAEYVIPATATENVRVGAAATNPTMPAGSVYVGKNANYTYVDRNNVMLAMINPITGEVLVPSGHRHNLFNATSATPPPVTMRLAPPVSVSPLGGNNGLPAASDDWLTPEGRFRILRPRPADHVFNGTTEFPYCPPNPDGTYTGDVQNQRYTDGRQRNDSFWMMTTPDVYTWRGKRIMPLVAPLIIPLDGRVNVNVAGNNRGTGGTHGSNQGFGPWEVNLANVIPTNSATVIANRHGGAAVSAPRGTPTVTNKFFHPDPIETALQLRPYDRSRVDWDGGGSVSRMALPTGFTSDPVWPNATSGTPGPYDNSAQLGAATETPNHPGLYMPYQWDPFTVVSTFGTAPGTFPLSDYKQLARYSGRPGLYNGSVLGRNYSDLNSELTGDLTPNGPGDLVNVYRSLITPVSNTRKVHGLAPNFLDDSVTLSSTGGAVPSLVPTLPGGTAPPILNVTPGVGATAFAKDGSSNNVRNLRAALSSVNLNRPLADYRGSTVAERAASLSDTNIVNAATAWADRLVLARDIFQRLVIVSGGKVAFTNGVMYLPQPTGMAAPPYQIDDGVNPVVPVTQGEYDALRWLAQLAANIVDYIDNDDINTPYVWNPDPAAPISGNPYDAGNFAASPVIDNRVVFGTEKPRLSINEVYAEIANIQTEAAGGADTTGNEVRFFIEVLNSGNTESSTTNPIPQNAPLRYPGGGTPYSVYQIEIHTNGAGPGGAASTLAQPGNVTGFVAGAFRTATITPTVVATAAAVASADAVEPNNGNYTATVAARNGFAVIGPALTDPPPFAMDPAFTPNTSNAASVHSLMLQKLDEGGGVDALRYNTGVSVTEATFMGAGANSFATLNANRHAVLLRRLANPYLPASATNPYITVDYAARVYINDSIRVFSNGAGMSVVRTGGAPAPTTKFGTGRVGPYTGDESADPWTLGTTFNTSLTVRQQNAPGGVATGTQHSLFRHNGTTDTAPAASEATLRFPYAWLTHLDRRLVNQMELLHVSGFAAHHLTHAFAIPTAAGEPAQNRHEFLQVSSSTNAPLYRALETLSVKPWGHGLVDGGRVPGKVNVNMIWDQRVLQAILDGRAAAAGGPNYMLDTDVTTIWTNMTNAVSPNARTPGFPVVGLTRDEDPSIVTNPTPDRPIRGLGQPVFSVDMSVNAALPNGSGQADTILGRGFAIGQTNPYLAAEPLRKAHNNLTTTSDSYLMLMTVGWFEVRNTGTISVTNPPKLGKEVYDRVPGDMRVQYSGVIDRTNLATSLTSTGVETGVQAGPQLLWTTELATPPTATTTPNEYYVQFLATGGSPTTAQIHYDGQTINFATGMNIRLGMGTNAETISITGLGATIAGPVTLDAYNPTTGLATVRFTSLTVPTVRSPGDPVTGNAKFMSPGPQPSFDVRLPSSRGVVRYWTQIPP